MTAPEFREILIDESIPDLADEHGKAVGLISVRAPTRPQPMDKDPEDLHSFGQSSTNSFRLGDKALDTTENSFNGLQNHSGSGFEAMKRENPTIAAQVG